MTRPPFEVADIILQYGTCFIETQRAWLTAQHLRVLRAIAHCRTAALGGHLDRCAVCGHRAISFNSCRNRHLWLPITRSRVADEEDQMKSGVDHTCGDGERSRCGTRDAADGRRPRKVQRPFAVAGRCGGDKEGESSLCGRADVPMVPPVDLWNCHDAPGGRRHHRSWSRRVLAEAQMCPRAHVVGDVDRDHPLQPRGIHMIEAFTPDRSDEAFDLGVPPR